MNRWLLRKNYHISWFVAISSATIVVGVFGSQFVQAEIFHSISWLLIGCLLILFACKKHQLFLIPVVIIGGLLVGFWRGSIDQLDHRIYQASFSKTVELRGVVDQDVSVGKNNQLTFRLVNNTVNGQKATGKVWLSTNEKLSIKRGDTVILHGKLQPGFGEFVATIISPSIQKIQRLESGDLALYVRDGFASAIRGAIDEPEASLGIGFLVGQKSALPTAFADALVLVGLTHIVVASGYNLTILVRFARRLFSRISKYLATLVSGSLILGFIAITGLSPSMSRAGLIAGLSLAAWYLGRKFHPLVLLPFSAAITLLFNPSFAWGDVGWELSFAAFAGVMIMAPLAQAYFFGDKKPGLVKQILGETLAAQLATLPLIIMMFGQFSNIATVANLLVLPFLPIAMLLTFFAGICFLISPSLAQITAMPAEWLLGYMVFVVEKLSTLSWATTQISFGVEFVVISYVVLIGACIFMSQKTKTSLRDANIIE